MKIASREDLRSEIKRRLETGQLNNRRESDGYLAEVVLKGLVIGGLTALVVVELVDGRQPRLSIIDCSFLS